VIVGAKSIAVMMALGCLATAHAPVAAASIYANQSDVGNQLCIPVHSWTNPDKPVKGVIVALQGLIFSGKMFEVLANHFTDKGYIVYANDMRGFGDWRETDHKFAGDSAIHFGQSKDDLTDILKALRKKYPGKPIFCVGESFGANMAVWEASTEPGLMDGAIASGVVAKTRVHPRPLWVKTFFQGIHNPNNRINIRPYMEPILSEDKQIAQELIEDDHTVKEMSITNLIKAAVTNKNSVKEIARIPPTLPILLMAGKKDRVQKTEALAEMVPKMGSKETTLVIFADKGHMLLECSRLDPEVSTVMDNWLDQQQEAFEKKIAAAANSSQANLSSTGSSGIESSTATPDDGGPADAFSKNDEGVI
jgi:alpha-beta hydrolase superfamily lysophospholipase